MSRNACTRIGHRGFSPSFAGALLATMIGAPLAASAVSTQFNEKTVTELQAMMAAGTLS